MDIGKLSLRKFPAHEKASKAVWVGGEQGMVEGELNLVCVYMLEHVYITFRAKWV